MCQKCDPICPYGCSSETACNQDCTMPFCDLCIDDKCSRCVEYAVLTDGQCTCAYPSGANCTRGPCPANCQECEASKCVECERGYIRFNDACIIECPTGYRHSGKKCVLEYYEFGFTFDMAEHIWTAKTT